MTEEQMRELVSTAFVDGWTAAHPDIDFALDNELGKLPPVGHDNFAMLTIALTTSAQTTQGGRGIRRYRRDGWLQVKLWTPADTGARGAARLADTVRDLLEGVELPSPIPGDEPVVINTGYAKRSWTDEAGVDGKWFMSLVRIPLYFAQTK